MPNKIDLTGKVFKHFTVVKESGKDKYGNIKWECLCNCGKTFVSPRGSITSKHRTSCGCKAYAWTQKRVDNDKAYRTTMNHRLSLVERNAVRKGREWKLTKELTESLILSNCYYCGVEPNQRYNLYCNQDGDIRRTGNFKRIENGWITVHGIDRIDSSKGYLPDNVRPCCKDCNRSKSDLIEDDFKVWIERLYNNYCRT